MLIAGVVTACLLISHRAMTFTSGAPQGRNGSPASTASCAGGGCHSGPGAGSQNITISTDIPAAGFDANTNYTITVTADDGGSGISKMGFQASVEGSMGSEGLLSTGGNSNLQKTGNYITHRTGGTPATGGMRTWTFDWDSQSADDGATIYVAVNFSNSNSNAGGDIILLDQLVLDKASGIGIGENESERLNIYPNPAVDVIRISDLDPHVAEINVFDLTGKKLLSFGNEYKVSAHDWEFSIDGLTPGTYMVQAGDSSQKLLVQ